MPDDSRVQQLLDEILDSNRTPEDVCANEPAAVLFHTLIVRDGLLMRMASIRIKPMNPTPTKEMT